MIIIEIFFWISIFSILHSYVLYPLILSFFSRNKSFKHNYYTEKSDAPKVSILMSLFNEEEVIAEKLDSIFNTSYPLNKIEILIGSDNSVDKTNEIVEAYSKKYSQLVFIPFFKRQGKGNIINQLYEKANGNILILSDANVIFDKNTIWEVIKYFKSPKIGLVDTNMINKGLKKDGISVQEKSYISREVVIKNQESRLWGTMMGPFGGCYAIRKELYSPVPANFLVDDFYINMKILEQKYLAINNFDAKVYEDVSNNLQDEFRRKIRIATGNFQNLKEFSKLLFPLNTGLSFSFLSHKVLRWLGPFFLLELILDGVILSYFYKQTIYIYILILLSLSLLVPLLDFLLKKINVHIKILRFITHFYTMNLALFIGFFKFLKGVESNVWKPTKRNQ